jgi:hypothetical protein
MVEARQRGALSRSIDKLQDLLAGKVGREPAAAEWEAAVKEGNERAERHEPPGYLDAEKVDSDLPEGAAGDYLVWVQATDEGTRRHLDVLLVTGMRRRTGGGGIDQSSWARA